MKKLHSFCFNHPTSESRISCRIRGFLFWIITFSVAAQATPNLTVDGSQTFQTLDGLGVNINVNSWKNGQLRPALDYLVVTNGASVMRVIRDPMDWVSNELLIPKLHRLDVATLRHVYEAPKMQDIWNTIRYLNQKGLRGNAIMLNFMGWTPRWLGGSGAYGSSSYITPGKEGKWATMVASLVYYGRIVKKLDFKLLAPLNEQDWNCLEGPCVSPSQYVTALKALIAELSAMKLSDIRLVGPDTAGSPGVYLTSMMRNSAIARRVAHIGLHGYGGPIYPETLYPPPKYWVTETASSCGNCDYAGVPSQGEWNFAAETNDFVLQDLSNGLTNVLIYDGYDSFYYHHNSYGYWGLLSYDKKSKVYTPRKRFYVNAQLDKFIRPGMKQLAENDTIDGLGTTVAFYNPTTRRFTIAGHNTNSTAITINGQLRNLPAISSLFLYETNKNANLQRRAVPVSGPTFSVQIRGDTFFTLTGSLH
jgi:hypothetical protein